MPHVEGRPAVPVPPQHQPSLRPVDSLQPGEVDQPSVRDLLDAFLAKQRTRSGVRPNQPTAYERFLSLFPNGDEVVSDAELEAVFAHRKYPRGDFSDAKFHLNQELKHYGLRIVRFSAYYIEQIPPDEY